MWFYWYRRSVTPIANCLRWWFFRPIKDSLLFWSCWFCSWRDYCSSFSQLPHHEVECFTTPWIGDWLFDLVFDLVSLGVNLVVERRCLSSTGLGLLLSTIFCYSCSSLLPSSRFSLIISWERNEFLSSASLVVLFLLLLLTIMVLFLMSWAACLCC